MCNGLLRLHGVVADSGCSLTPLFQLGFAMVPTSMTTRQEHGTNRLTTWGGKDSTLGPLVRLQMRPTLWGKRIPIIPVQETSPPTVPGLKERCLHFRFSTKRQTESLGWCSINKRTDECSGVFREINHHTISNEHNKYTWKNRTRRIPINLPQNTSLIRHVLPQFRTHKEHPRNYQLGSERCETNSGLKK